MAIISKDDLQQGLKIKKDENSELTQRIAAGVSSAIETFINRHIEAKRVTEFHNGTGDSSIVFVKNFPIIGISAMWDDPDRAFDDTTLFATSDFTFDPSVGWIELINTTRSSLVPSDGTRFSKGVRNIRITFTAGYSTVPDDIVQAALDWGGHLYKQTDNNAFGVTSIERADIAQGIRDLGKMPEGVKELLNPYRVRNV